MDEAKFTKGEWLVWESHDDEDFAPRRDDNVIVGMGSYNENPYEHYTVHKIVMEGDSGDEEMIANAHLIAAAPDMYALLDKLSPMLTDINAHLVVNEIDALLAKARGENE